MVSIVTQLDVLEAISGSQLIRWAGFRRLTLGSRQKVLPLDNDGNLSQQLAGLNRWLDQTAELVVYPEDDFKPTTEHIALAQVARQIAPDRLGKETSSANTLLNMQDKNTKQKEAENLQTWAGLLSAEKDANLSTTFQLVASILEGNDEGALQMAIKQHLGYANAAFYLETGLEAAKKYHEALKDIQLQHISFDSPDDVLIDNLSAESRLYLLLAANAWVNNAQKISDLPAGHPAKVVLSLLESFNMVTKPDLHKTSRAVAFAYPTSSVVTATATANVPSAQQGSGPTIL